MDDTNTGPTDKGPLSEERLTELLTKALSCWEATVRDADRWLGRANRLVEQVTLIQNSECADTVKCSANRVAGKVTQIIEYLCSVRNRAEHYMDLNNQRTAFYANSQRGECVLLADLQSYSISHYTVESILHFEEMVEALQFAVTATQNGTETKEVSQAQRALSSVLAGVNKLRDLGMSHAEIIDHIGAYIDIRWEHDTPLQSLRENPDRPQETRRNQRSQGGKREQLFSENEDIRDFRGRFWLAFWEASYEKGRPRVEREEHIELLLHSIPAVLHGSKGPMSQVELCDKFQFANRRNPRVRDAIVRAACTILLDRSSGQPRDIVEVGATCRLWTRQHAVVAGLMIASRPQGRNVSGPVRNSSGA